MSNYKNGELHKSFVKTLWRGVVGAAFCGSYLAILERAAEAFLGLSAEQPLQQHSFADTVLLRLTLVASLLNCSSHIAVVSGLLQDTYTVSILIGVGFDVLSNFLYFAALCCLTKSKTNFYNEIVERSLFKTGLTLVIALAVQVYLFWAHVRALRLGHSLSRIQQVTKSAWNNLRGDPGPWYMDHLFAYLDLAHHMFMTLVALRAFDMALRSTAKSSMLGLLLLLVSSSALSMNQQSGNEYVRNTPGRLPSRCLSVDPQTDKATCYCFGDGAKHNAFSVDWRNGRFCLLWFHSFRQVYEMSLVEAEQ